MNDQTESELHRKLTEAENLFQEKFKARADLDHRMFQGEIISFEAVEEEAKRLDTEIEQARVEEDAARLAWRQYKGLST